MRVSSRMYALMLTLLVPICLWADPALTPVNVTVGRNLQAPAKVTLEQQASFAGLQVTITSDDPARSLLAKRTDVAGTASLVLEVNPGSRETPEFWIQGLANSGEITYTATAPGFETGKGKITLTPSGIAIFGPFRAPKFPTTVRAEPSRILLQSVRLDAELKLVEQQPVAGGKTARFEIQTSKPEIGVVANMQLAIPSGNAGVTTEFQPSKMGETTLSVKPPEGFNVPADTGAVTAMVIMPGLAVTDQVMLGHNLQIAANLGLGQPAPPEGLEVTLTSEDPDRLLLARKAQDKGQKSLKIMMPPDGVLETFYLQGFANSGSATYTASAPGYRTRTAIIALAPSGVVITPRPYGPPDEAEFHRKRGEPEGERGFVTHLSRSESMGLVVWTVQLHPETHRSADITVQELRAGLTLQVPLTVSNPAIAQVAESMVTINGGDNHAKTEFKPLKPGSTLVSVVTPKDFTPSANSTSVTALVKE
jgi:hypothetical protein